MTIRHHPPGELLTSYAAGTLDLGEHIAVATHLGACARCQTMAREMEHVGGAVLLGLTPMPMSDDSEARVLARLDMPETPPVRPPLEEHLENPPGLPAFARRYKAAPWTWIAPGVWRRPILLPVNSGTRVFLLKSAPGTKMLEHSHTGTELTCVLTGGFRHAAGDFGPGDFDWGDATVCHDVVVAPSGPCLCLVAMRGGVRLTGFLGALLQPFVRL